MGTFFRGRILMRIWCRLGGPGSDAERRSYDLPIDGTVTTVYKDVVTDTKSDDTRKFVAETKECGHFDPLLLGEMVYKEFTETRYQSRIDVYEVSDMDVANTGPLFGTPVSVKVRVGAVEVETKKQKVAAKPADSAPPPLTKPSSNAKPQVAAARIPSSHAVGLLLLPNATLYERGKLIRWFGIDRHRRSGGSGAPSGVARSAGVVLLTVGGEAPRVPSVPACSVGDTPDVVTPDGSVGFG
mgnify:CR=1 FL=1